MSTTKQTAKKPVKSEVPKVHETTKVVVVHDRPDKAAIYDFWILVTLIVWFMFWVAGFAISNRGVWIVKK